MYKPVYLKVYWSVSNLFIRRRTAACTTCLYVYEDVLQRGQTCLGVGVLQSVQTYLYEGVLQSIQICFYVGVLQSVQTVCMKVSFRVYQ